MSSFFMVNDFYNLLEWGFCPHKYTDTISRFIILPNTNVPFLSFLTCQHLNEWAPGSYLKHPLLPSTVNMILVFLVIVQNLFLPLPWSLFKWLTSARLWFAVVFFSPLGGSCSVLHKHADESRLTYLSWKSSLNTQSSLNHHKHISNVSLIFCLRSLIKIWNLKPGENRTLNFVLTSLNNWASLLVQW